MSETADQLTRLMVDNIPHGIFTIDAEGRITSFNHAAEETTGWKEDEVIGQRCSEVFRSDHCATSCFLLDSVRQGELHRDREVMIRKRDGTPLRVSVSTAALTDERGEPQGGVEMFRDLSLVVRLRRRLNEKYTIDDIVAESEAMQEMRTLLPMVARSDSTVLIEGEAGTGKELVARAIHNQGPRKGKPFVAVNCGAIPESLLESELFGHMRGAFTDAKRDRVGRFALAEGGTLLLDEIGELSPKCQVKLLRVLQEREFTPLGAVTPVKADVRIIAATNRDLAREVSQGNFRQDLYFRLDVVRIPLPPLRARPEDIPLLTMHFVDQFNAMQGRSISGVSEDAMEALRAYGYPGNVRELENAVEHAFVVCVGDRIELDHLPHSLRDGPSTRPAAPNGLGLLESAEANAIRRALEDNAGNRTRAAAALGISRNTLWRKMKRYGID